MTGTPGICEKVLAEINGLAPDEGIAYSQRMVALLIDGLRYAAEPQRPS